MATSYFNFQPSDLGNPVFVFQEYRLLPFFASLLNHIVRIIQLFFSSTIHFHLQTGLKYKYVSIAPIQWHSLVMAAFASAIGPFGGFFASGFKRAFKVKDFADSIPGHGGLTDRMDCQFLMGFFSYLYLSTFIKISHTTVAQVLQTAIDNLSSNDQIALYNSLKTYLESQGLIWMSH